jgi:hypothetical protein
MQKRSKWTDRQLEADRGRGGRGAGTAIRWLLVASVTGVAAGGCASARITGPELPPAERLSTSLVALQEADYANAYDNLLLVRSVCGDSPMGQQALLVLAAAELDPRNPERHIELAAEFAAHYLGLPNRAAWAEPLAESLYLLSMEIGAADAVGSLLGAADADGDPGAVLATTMGPNDTSATDPALERAETLRRAVFGFVPNPVPAECEVDWQGVADSGEPSELPVLPLSPVTDGIAELEQERVELRRRQAEMQTEIDQLTSELERIRETLRP